LLVSITAALEPFHVGPSARPLSVDLHLVVELRQQVADLHGVAGVHVDGFDPPAVSAATAGAPGASSRPMERSSTSTGRSVATAMLTAAAGRADGLASGSAESQADRTDSAASAKVRRTGFIAAAIL